MAHSLSLPPPLEFHLSRLARIQNGFNRDLLRRPAAALPVPDVQAVQELAARMNRHLGEQGRGVKPGHLYALVLIQHILHVVIDLYRRQKEHDVFRRAEEWLTARQSAERLQETLRTFTAYYAPLSVIKTERSLDGYFAEQHGDVPGRHLMLEQMLLVFLANINPAAASSRTLYDDRELPARDDYLNIVWSLESFFAAMPTFGPQGQSLFELLAAPAKSAPDSLLGQLEFIRRTWADLLGDALIRALLTAEDLVREDEKTPWQPPALGQAPDLDYLKALAGKGMFAHGRDEPERFSADTDWMPRVVMLAKSVYVWLDQLTKQYGRAIRRLDEIPDAELQRLSDWGFSGLWLIGLWERSEASRTIKNLRGNSDAVASAYSLYDYRISGDLGGQDALDNLKARAAARGIRLASDMVPNHMGIDSRWVREHPDWFLQLDYPPYGAYQYTGPDLSGEPNIDLRIEDGYWHQTDAAVTFRRVDKPDGRARYIYHGNDGTSMPWNDTAQLDFLRADVREAVIQLILHVARSFPIMRFDAAMTLTKLHYQRLWFPAPGTGGAIPSRALFGMTKHEFDRHFPAEFWREVVDRVAAEAPGTLLLAEAFWLLEGYFVRTLGMHRVYNSAFMNMLKLEENAKYRSVLKNVLEFDPRILQRFVNFMNNPDEDTAVAQFGKGDKYFGVCMLLATTPGLPMFGHGQIEGFTEKYGHEFQRAYYDEQPDADLIRRHEREIFPLLRQRHLFSGSEHFLLYDVYRENGEVEENVIAQSNGYGDARALVVFHNRWAETRGWIHTSAAYSVPDGAGRSTVRKTLAEGLGLRADADVFYILRDRIAGLDYLRRGPELCRRGLFIALKAYQYQVFTEFREVRDDREGRWAQLCDILNGRGVPSVEREFKRVHLAPLIDAFAAVCTAETFRALLDTPPVAARSRSGESIADGAQFAAQLKPFLQQAAHFGGGTARVDKALRELSIAVPAALALRHPLATATFSRTADGAAARDHWVRCVPEPKSSAHSFWRIMGGWLLVWGTGRLVERDGERIAAERLDDWLLAERLADVFQELGADEAAAWREVAWVRTLLAYQKIALTFDAPQRFAAMIKLLDDAAARALIGVNEHAGVLWFHMESFAELMHRLYAVTIVDANLDSALTKPKRGQRITRAWLSFRHMDELCVIAEHKLERLRTLLSYAAPLVQPGAPQRKAPARKVPARKTPTKRK